MSDTDYTLTWTDLSGSIDSESQQVSIVVVASGSGPAGATGATGATGAAGEGVPTGGTTNQTLTKASGTDYDTQWSDAVPTTRTVNGHALSADVTVTASDVSAVPTTRTVNGHALSANVTIAESDISGLTSDLAAKAPLASPALTGTPTAPTASALTDNTQVATTAYVDAAAAQSKVNLANGFSLDRMDNSRAFMAYDPAGKIVATYSGSPGGRTLTTSADNGATWTALGTPSATGTPSNLWFSSAGSWFAYTGDHYLNRSTDHGVTWTQVLQIDQVHAGLGSMLGQGFTQTPDGTLWVAQYIGGTIWRSVDDGVTWTVAFTFTSSDQGDASPTIRHLHGIQSLASGLWAFTGDNNTQCGFWKWDGSSTFVRESPAVADPDGQVWRAVGLIERDGMLYWAQDGSGGNHQPAIFKADPTNLAGTVEEIVQLPTGGWYSVLASDDTILIGGVVEDSGASYALEQDRSVRVWAITTDDIVSEIFSTDRGAGKTGVLPYSSISNLSYRASDGQVAFVAQDVEWGDGTVYGTVTTDGAKLVVSPASTPAMYSTPPRKVWWASPSTSSPSYTGAVAVVPEMSVVVPSRKRPLKITATITLRNSAVGTKSSISLTANSAVINGSSSSANADYTADNLGWQQTMLQVIYTPTNFLDQTIELVWVSPGGGVNVSTYGFKRSLIIEEL